MRGSRRRAVLLVAVLVLSLVGLYLWFHVWTDSPEASAVGSAVASGRARASAAAPSTVRSDEPELLADGGARAVRSRSAARWLGQRDVPDRRIAGHVTFTGVGVAGAVVRLDSWSSVGDAVETRSNTDGSFDFGEQLAKAWTVSAAAPGRTGAVLQVDLRDPLMKPAPEALELKLTACDARLVGKVLEASGTPIPRARVRQRSAVGTETDAAGSYELCVPPGNVDLGIDADGYGGLRLSLLVLGRTERDLVLVPESFVIGRVVLAGTNAPVEGARVTVFPAVWGRSTSATVNGVSGPAGRFRISVSPGEHRAAAVAERASTLSPVLVTTVAGMESEPITLRLEALSQLSGHVMSAGKPIAGAQVTAINSTGMRSAGVSQRDGSYTIDYVVPGDVSFTAAPWEVVSPNTFRVVKSAEVVDLEVKKLASLHGKVTREGKPVEGVEVSVSGGTQEQPTLSSSDGTYEVRGLAGGTYQVTAQSERLGAFTDAKVTIAPGEDQTLDLELGSAGSIAGTVVDQSGKPAVSVMVTYVLAKTGDMGRSVTDTDGRFLCNQMTGGGAYMPSVTSSAASRIAYKPAGAPFTAVVVADGKTHIEGITLAIKLERMTISGKVVDASGQAVPDAKVQALAVQPGEEPRFNSWLQLPAAVTDGQGAFSIGGLISGDYALQARSSEGDEGVLPSATAGATGVTITVQRRGGIDGTLVGFTEPPVIYAQSTSGTHRLIPGQVEGAVFHLRMPAGAYFVTAMSKADGDAKRVEVRDGAISQVTMTNRGHAMVTGSVVEHGTRTPVPGLHCHAVNGAGGEPGVTNWSFETSPLTDERGEFTVEPSPAGEINVSCVSDVDEISRASAQVTVERGGHVVVPLEIVRRTGSDGDIGAELNPRLSTPTIVSVAAGGPAARAGLAPGDVIVGVDGVPTSSLDTSGVEMLIENHAPGSSVVLAVVHLGQPKTVTVAVGQHPP